MVGCCEHGNEPLSYIKCGEILWLAEQLVTFEEGLWFMGFQSTKHIVCCNSWCNTTELQGNPCRNLDIWYLINHHTVLLHYNRSGFHPRNCVGNKNDSSESHTQDFECRILEICMMVNWKMTGNFANITFIVKTAEPLAPKLDGCNSAHNVRTILNFISKTDTV